jgi:ABC-2 type transport system permease protein
MQSRFHRLLATLRFFVALSGSSLRASMARRLTFAMQVAFMIANNLIFLTFWWLLFARVPHIRGYQLADVAVMFGIVGTAFGLVQTFAGGVRHLARLIDDGALDSLLPQPKPTLLYALGARTQPSGIGDVLSGVALLALSGKLTLATVPLAVLACVSSAVVFVATGVVFFSVAFWLPKTESLSAQTWELLITFSLYPEPLFGGAIRLLLFSALPAAFVGFVPLRLVLHATFADFALLAAAATSYVTMALWVFRRGLRRYSSGSRFGILG